MASAILGSLFGAGPGFAYNAMKGNKSGSSMGGSPSKQNISSSNNFVGEAPKGYLASSTLNPGQQNLFTQLIDLLQGGQSQNPLQKGATDYWQNLLSNDPEAYKKFESPFLRQFNEQTVPGLAERFAGMGAGAQSSSAFQNALGQHGAALSENLAALRSGLQGNAANQGFNAAQTPIQQLLEALGLNTQALVPKSPSFLKQLGVAGAQGVGEGVAKFATSFLGG